jgi:hypothetical protein
MMWLRRTLAVMLIVISALLLLALLPITQANDTAANPTFYTDRLEKADVYNFIYDELIPAGLDELEPDDPDDSPVVVERIQDDLISAARKAVPPDWIQIQVEAAIESFLPYIVGDTDSFTVNVSVRDRVEAAADVFVEDIVRGSIFADAWNDALSYVAGKLHENLDELPYSLKLSEADLEESLTGAFPADWAAREIEAAIDSVVPYLTSDAEHFTITVHLIDLIDSAAAAAIDILSRQETYDFLMDELVQPMVDANIGMVVDLGYGITLSRDEVRAAIEQVLPAEWMRARLSDIIGAIAAFINGDASQFEVSIDLGDRKAVALDVLTDVADDKLRAVFDDTPECSMSEFLLVMSGLPPNTLPSCRPSGVPYEAGKLLLGIDVAAEVDRAIGDHVPDQWVYTEGDLRQLLAEQDAEALLDDAREWVTEGWTFTDYDLKEELDNDGLEALEDAREWIRDGYTATEVDLEDAISDAGDDPETIEDLRGGLHSARTWLGPVWLVPFLLLFGAGMLAGRSWPGRLAWALVPLFLTALVFYIVTGAVYSGVGRPRLQESLDSSEYEGATVVVVDKGHEIAVDSLDAYVSGMRGKALYIVLGSAAGLVVATVWSRKEPYGVTSERTGASSSVESDGPV